MWQRMNEIGFDIKQLSELSAASSKCQRIRWGIIESSLPAIAWLKSQNNEIMDDLMAI